MIVARALRLLKKPLICFVGVSSLLVSAAYVHAQIPDLAEARQMLIEQGMSPAKADEILKQMAMSGAEASGGNDVLAAKGCEDSNDNDVCDDEEGEEDDSETIRCRVSYLDAITKFALDNYGTRLGDDPIGIGLTCQAASVSGVDSARLSLLPSSLSGGREFENALEYWDAVMRHGAELSSSLRRRYERIERSPPALRLSELSRDLRPLARNDDERDSFDVHLTPAEEKRQEFLVREYFRLAAPVERRCENIRRNVGAYYRAQYPDGAVCLVNVPEDDDESEDMPGDEE